MHAREVDIHRRPRQLSISSACLSDTTTVCLVDPVLTVLDRICIISLHRYALMACDADIAL